MNSGSGIYGWKKAKAGPPAVQKNWLPPDRHNSQEESFHRDPSSWDRRTQHPLHDLSVPNNIPRWASEPTV